MALVDYSSSEEDEKETPAQPTAPPTNLKRKRGNESSAELPPLPSKFHDLYASTTRISMRDDPSFHGGRKRVIPHIEGNWPTHLYIEWYPSKAESGLLTVLISKLQAYARLDANVEIHSSLTSELDVPLPLHISLSRSLGFSAEKKGEFVDSLERAVKASGIRPFDVQFTGLDCVANFEKTRWFLVLRLHKPNSDGLNRLLSVCNEVVEARDQLPLYKPPQEPTEKKIKSMSPRSNSRQKPYKSEKLGSTCYDASDAFHFSIAWTLEKPGLELLQFTNALKTDQLDDIKSIKVKVDEIKAKVGNVVSNMPLLTDIVLSKSLFGI